MDAKTKLWLASIGSGVLFLASGYGHLEPRYTLADGSQTHAWAVAKASGQQVVDISPSLGWLKLLSVAGALLCGVYAINLSHVAEEEEEQGKAFSRAQRDFMLEQQKLDHAAQLEAMRPVAEIKAADRANREALKLSVAGALAALPQTEIVSVPPAPEEHQQNFAQLFGENPKTALVIGVPGAGKGVFVSNAIRHLKRCHPDVWVMGIDPKNDPKEEGYWKEGFDYALRWNQENMDGEALLNYLERAVKAFKDRPGPKLLVFDELKICCKRMKDTDAKRFRELINYFVFLASSGDSQQIFFWGVGQSANAEDYGINGGDRGVFKPVAIASKTDVAATKQLLGTKYAPTDSPSSVLLMMEESPVGRAIYWYPDGQWYPMPELHNYSGYNRDKRMPV